MSLQIIPIKTQKEIVLDANLVDLILESSEINDGDIPVSYTHLTLPTKRIV